MYSRHPQIAVPRFREEVDRHNSHHWNCTAYQATLEPAVLDPLVSVSWLDERSKRYVDRPGFPVVAGVEPPRWYSPPPAASDRFKSSETDCVLVFCPEERIVSPDV